jgi:hypothetical protein
MSEKSVAQKLGLKPGKQLLVKQPPGEIETLVGALPSGAELIVGGTKPCALILLFAGDKAALVKALPGCKRQLEPGGALWVAYIKGTSSKKTDVNRTAFENMRQPSASTPCRRLPSTTTGLPCD